jgi:hypothetical protein
MPVSCGEVPAGIGPLLQARRTIVLGDLPGTREVPELVGRIACHAVATGVPVRLVLELPDGERKRVDAYLRSRGDLDDRIALIRGAFWRSSTEVSASDAMLALLERIRVWRAADVPIDLVFADAWATAPRDAEALVLALVDPTRAHDGDRVALRIVAGGGERWACSTAGLCGARMVAGTGDGFEPRVRWTAPPPGWDGVFYVGVVSASPPVLEPPP